MPRAARIVIPGLPHHVVQRGNNRRSIFFADEDRRTYLDLLKGHSEEFGLNVLGYCLLDDHVHLIAIPLSEESLAKGVGRTHYRYAQQVNRRYGSTGHLWENRFQSCALDEAHLGPATQYIERSPVRAKLVRVAWRYPWSSAAAHVGEAEDTGLLDLEAWQVRWPAADWKETLREQVDEEIVRALRLNTSRGRPFGTDRFLDKLERQLGRRLRPRPVGRPRKEAPRPKRRRKR